MNQTGNKALYINTVIKFLLCNQHRIPIFLREAPILSPCITKGSNFQSVIILERQPSSSQQGEAGLLQAGLRAELRAENQHRVLRLCNTKRLPGSSLTY